MPGGWEFYSPTIYYGRLFMACGGYWSPGRVLIPAKLIHAKRWLNPAYRRAGRVEPMRADS